MDLSQKKVTVIGLGRSGQAAARLLFRRNAVVRLSEQSAQADINEDFIQWARERQIPIEHGHTAEFVTDSDLLIISPGVRIDAQPVRWAREKNIPVWSELELAARFCPARIIAVTGSNGKTTVTTLIKEILVKAGRRAITAGNIGSPLSDFVHELSDESWAVLEVSSFQLETIDRFKPHVAVFLNFSQNHLDRHKDLKEYFQAKKRLFLNQNENDFAVLNAADERVRMLAGELNARVVYFNGGDPDEELLGANPNFKAAYRAARVIGIDPGLCVAVCQNFKGVEHRLEKVRCLGGIEFINDSKSTTVEAGRWALERIDKPIIMICGGRDKHIDFSPLRDLVSRKVKHLIVIGESRDKITRTFRSVVDTRQKDDLAQALHVARELARSGDCVLLSPMCASFDMFLNYEERGRIFKDLVKNLPE